MRGEKRWIMGLGNWRGFSYEPIGENAEALPLQHQQWSPKASVRKNIGTLLMSFGVVTALWGSARTSFGTSTPSSSPTLAASAAANASFAALQGVDDGVDAAAASTSAAGRMLKQVRVFTEPYRSATNTTRYAPLVAEPHRENTLEVDVSSDNLGNLELR